MMFFRHVFKYAFVSQSRKPFYKIGGGATFPLICGGYSDCTLIYQNRTYLFPRLSCYHPTPFEQLTINPDRNID